MKIYKNESNFIKDLEALKYLHLDSKIKPINLFMLMNIYYDFTYKIDDDGKLIWFYREPTDAYYQELTKIKLLGICSLIRYVLNLNYDSMKLSKSILRMLRNKPEIISDSNISRLNPSPDHLILTKNGLYDTLNKTFISDNSNEYNEIVSTYHFMDRPTFNYIEDYKKSEDYDNFINHISSYNDEIKNEIELLIFNLITKLNNKTVMIIESTSDYNRTILYNLMRDLIDYEKVEILRLSKLKKVDSSLNVILGDNLLPIKTLNSKKLDLLENLKKTHQVIQFTVNDPNILGSKIIKVNKIRYNTDLSFDEDMIDNISSYLIDKYLK